MRKRKREGWLGYYLNPREVAKFFYAAIYYDSLPKKKFSISEKLALGSVMELIDTRLADIFRDYLCLTIGGELRHATHYCYSLLRMRAGHVEAERAKFNIHSFTSGTHRTAAIEQVVTHTTRRSVINLASKLFRKRWESGYGGTKWYAVVKVLEEYLKDELTPRRFIDKCFFIVHNGGTFFNKSVIFSCEPQQEVELRHWLGRKDSKHVDAVMEKVKFKDWLKGTRPIRQQIQSYEPIKWGKVTLKLVDMEGKKYAV